jgi:hypothetical protein
MAAITIGIVVESTMVGKSCNLNLSVNSFAMSKTNSWAAIIVMDFVKIVSYFIEGGEEVSRMDLDWC